MAKIKVLRVVAKSGSFRRAGYQFTSESTDIPLDELKKEDREAIQKEPALVSYEIEVDDADIAKSATTPDDGKKPSSSTKK